MKGIAYSGIFCFSCWDISVFHERIGLQNTWKSQIFNSPNMTLECIKTIFGIQRRCLKSFLVISGQFWTTISFWKKKKSPKFAQIWTKMPKISDFWNFNCGYLAEDGRYSPKNISKVPACPKFLPKFFLSPKLKNWWKYSKTATPPPPPPEKSTFRGGG